MKADEKECEQYLAAWDAYKAGDKKIVKFVPASGAASRMFKNMFEFLGLNMTNLLQTLRRNSSTTFMILHSTMT